MHILTKIHLKLLNSNSTKQNGLGKLFVFTFQFLLFRLQILYELHVRDYFGTIEKESRIFDVFILKDCLQYLLTRNS